MQIPNYGIILNEKVDMDFLRSLEPQFFPGEYVKFVIDLNQNIVCVGMEIHADWTELLRETSGKLNLDETGIWGGNLYFDGRIVWTSTLNIRKNLALKEYDGNPRIISNRDIIDQLEKVLFEKISI